MADLVDLDAVGQAALVRSGEVSPSELAEAAIDRLERLDPKLGAVIHPDPGGALARVRAGGGGDGPFEGVPFLMKDIGGEEAGRPVHAGMRFLKGAGWTANQDSYFTQKVRAAGLVSLGRTNTPELALLPTSEPEAYGPTRNPWNLDYSSGGSSGGASAAVAAGIVAAAHASDGGGSIRGPASMCALVGLKPTRGRCSFGPDLGERWSGFSCEFALTRTVRDSAALLDALAGPMPGDPYFAAPPEESFASALESAPAPLRIGFMKGAPRGIEVHPDIVHTLERCAQQLESLGHHVEESHPAALAEESTLLDYLGVVAANVARALESWGEKVGSAVKESDVEALTWALANHGREITATQHIARLEGVHSLGRRLASWWGEGFDLLLTPTQASPPPRIGSLGSSKAEPLYGFMRSAPYGVFTLPFNLSGQPAISLPSGFTGDEAGEWPAGLPLGVQLVAPYGGERKLLQLAGQLEVAAPWSDLRPPLFG